MNRKFITFVLSCITVITLGLTSCTGSSNDGKFAGKYVDEFGNKFELRDDYTATIQFAGQETVNETRWGDGPEHDSPYATIEYNGDFSYYYMRDGVLYRYREDMEKGNNGIKIEKK